MLSNLEKIIRRFNGREFEIRRRYAREPEFRAICEDYVTATSALARWESDQSKAEEYRQLITDLEVEIREHLTEPP